MMAGMVALPPFGVMLLVSSSQLSPIEFQPETVS